MKVFRKGSDEPEFDTNDPNFEAEQERRIAKRRAEELGKTADKIEKFRKEFRRR